MDATNRLLKAWSFKEPDRVPIELKISPEACKMPEAERIVDFIHNEADNFRGVSLIDWGFFGLPATYREEVIEDVEGEYKRIKRTYSTEAGDFHAITKHKYETLDSSDYHWEQRYIHTLDDMGRLAEASRKSLEPDIERYREGVESIGAGGGIAITGLMHPLGRLVRWANMEEVYSWFLIESGLMHRFLERANAQVAETVEAIGRTGLNPVFGVCAHEMLILPWMGMRLFDEFVFPYDKKVNDAVHAIGGRLRAHCHGNCMEYLERMSEMGVDAIEPLEPPPFGDVDLKEAKRRVGDRMLLSGNVPSPLFVQMSREEVRKSVKDAISAAALGGGFTLRTTGGHAGTGSIQNREQEIKILENIEAYIEAGIEFGTYPIQV